VRVVFLPSRAAVIIGELKKKIEDLGHYAETFDEEEAPDSVREKVCKSDVVLAYGVLTDMGMYAWGYANRIGKKVVAIRGVLPVLCSRCTAEDTWLNSLPVQGALFQGKTDADQV
jgi:hypothetical protein